MGDIFKRMKAHKKEVKKRNHETFLELINKTDAKLEEVSKGQYKLMINGRSLDIWPTTLKARFHYTIHDFESPYDLFSFILERAHKQGEPISHVIQVPASIENIEIKFIIDREGVNSN